MLKGAEYGQLQRVLVTHARDAFGGQDRIAAGWRDLNFTAAPEFGRAIDQYERFVELLRRTGAKIEYLPVGRGLSLDAIYARDASVCTGEGVILCNMGKPQRAGEPAAHEGALRSLGIPIAGVIRGSGRLEGGDVAWLTARIVAVGRGYRTNDEGIRQFREMLGDSIDELIVVPLPHWRGPGDVFHLMSLISPVDRDLAVVYSPLMSVPFRERLLALGMMLVEVPDEEFESMGANVLAIAPRVCVMLAGNPITRRRLQDAGATAFEYEGSDISVKGGGGPTCLTRPLRRE